MTEKIDASQYAFSQIKPNHSVFFSRPPNNEQVGKLDFNGEKMTFEGEADESAKIFFDFLAECFAKRLEEERAAEREKFMAVCEAEYNKYDVLITEEDTGHEEATAIIHLMRKLEGMK